MAATTNRPKLVKIYDVRETDWNTGQKLPLTYGEGHVCHRCGRVHAKVYVVEKEGETVEVGSTCCKRLFDWEPLAEEIQRAMARTNGEKVAEKYLTEANWKDPFLGGGAIERDVAKLCSRLPNWAWAYQHAIRIIREARQEAGLYQ